MSSTSFTPEQLSNERKKVSSELAVLKSNLVNNHAIYHERVTLLIKLTQFDIGDTHVKCKAKLVKPLDRAHAEKSRAYRFLSRKDEIRFGVAFVGSHGRSMVNGTKIGGPYCPFILWTDPELVNFVMANGDELTKQLPPYLLWRKDWKVLKEKL